MKTEEVVATETEMRRALIGGMDSRRRPHNKYRQVLNVRRTIAMAAELVFVTGGDGLHRPPADRCANAQKRLRSPAMKSTEARTDPSQTWPERGAKHPERDVRRLPATARQRPLRSRCRSGTEDGRSRCMRRAFALPMARSPRNSASSCTAIARNESIMAFPCVDGPRRRAPTERACKRDGGYTPFYVRYNTGLPIAESGRHLAKLLQALAAAYPLPIEEIASDRAQHGRTP